MARDPQDLTAQLLAYTPAVTMVAAFPEAPAVSVPCAAIVLAALVVASSRVVKPAARVEVPLFLAAAPVALAAATLVDSSTVRERLGFWRFFPHRVEEENVGYFMVVMVAIFVTVALGAALRWMRTCDVRLVRVLAWLSTLFACATLVVVATRFARPTPSAYLASLPVLGTLEAPAESAARGTRIEQELGPLRVTRVALSEDGRGCHVWVARGASSPPPPEDPMRWETLGFSERCGRLVVRADDARRVWILETERGVRIAYDQIRARWPDPRPRERLDGALRPPNAHVALAAVGVLGALASLLLGRSGLPRDERACREGVVRADGTIAFASDEPPLSGLPHAPLPVGPVVAILGPASDDFRGHAGPVALRLLPGTLDEHRRARLAAPAFALAFAAVAATPLAVMLLSLG